MAINECSFDVQADMLMKIIDTSLASQLQNQAMEFDKANTEREDTQLEDDLGLPPDE